MRKILSLLVAAVLCCSLVSTAFAASGDYTFSVQTDGSPAVGDTITVTLSLSKSGAGEFDLYAMQDYVRFDPTYFTYVDQSLSVYTVKNGEQERAVFSASPLDFDEDGVIDRVYVNRASTNAEKVSSGVQVMQFQLRVKAQGSTALTQSGVEIFQDPAEMNGYNAPSVSITVRAAGGAGDSGNTGGNTSSGGSTGTKTETTANPDGSVTKTETKSDGTVIETTTGKDGSTSKTTTKPDGSSVTESKDTNGTTGTVRTDTNGKTEAEAKVSEKAVEDAKKSGEAVKVPTEIKAGENSSSAPTVKIELPKNAGETKIEIPVEDVNSGTVAVIVHPDGTEEIVKNSKPTEDGVQLTVDGNTVVKIIDNSKDFIDTRNHWSRDEVNFVASRDIFNGVGNNLFGVSQPMTRGMVNTVLARLAGIDTTPKNGQKWYEVGTEWAKSKGITDGTNPEASVTREQLATLLYRFYGSPAVSGTLRFADAGAVSAYAQDALLWATQNGILNGVGNNCVEPRADAQRAQVAAMFARYLKSTI